MLVLLKKETIQEIGCGVSFVLSLDADSDSMKCP